MHLGEVNKKGLEIKEWLKTDNLSDLEDYCKRNKLFKALKGMRCIEHEDMVSRINLTYNEIIYILD